jgi:glycerophosphoryl diester phosphodiesterase
VDIIAHRGASAYAPENTLAAFELAAAMEAHWFELDCTMSKDGEIVVIHDDDLERTAGMRGAVRDLTLAQIKEADAGTWFDVKFAGEPAPTLGEALDLAKGRIGVYIEIKDARDDGALRASLLELGARHGAFFPEYRGEAMALIENADTRNLETTLKVIQAVKSRGMDKQIVIQSFSPVVCAVALAEAPDLRTELLASSDQDDPSQWKAFLRWHELLRPHGFNINKADVTPEVLQRVHGLGQTMAVWTVNDPVEMERLIELGVDALITDKPDVGLRAAAGT